ncbi:uncharacterized protein LOC141857454 [Brevipalpus obovatus]|uniref:uncharacterized protein LOC141857454 n=1 Tax=Brevipalpus obovatus TaxID=246614 RepID=UPI003D9E3755
MSSAFDQALLIAHESIEAEKYSRYLMLEVRNYLQIRVEQDQEMKKNEENDSGSISGEIERQSIQEVQDYEPHGINMLPDEVLWNIFEQLEGHGDMLSCEMGTEISLPYCDYSEEDLTEYLKVANNLECLSLVGNLRITGKCFRHSLGIKNLMLGGCRKITNKGLELVSKLKNLEFLTLNLTRVTDEEVKKILLGCPSLTFLDLHGCYRISVKTLLSAYDLREKGLINERIIIRYGEEKVNIGAMSCRQEIENLGKRLKNGPGVFVSKFLIVPMSSTDNLIDQESALSPASSRSTCPENSISGVCDHGLSLRGQDRERREDEKIVSKLISDQIERQSTRDVEDCEPHGINILPYDVIRKIMDQLEGLGDLYACNLVVDKKKLYAILEKCPELRELHIRPYLDDNVTFFIIGNCCPKLERLVFIRAEFAGASLKSLIEYCSKLKAIYFSDCKCLANDNLKDFLKVAGGLEELILTNNRDITGKCFNHLPKIKLLDVRGCHQLTDESFTKLAEKCSSSLQRLKVGEISMRSLAIICESFPNLNRLAIDGIKIENGSPDLDRMTSSQLEKLEFLRIHDLDATINDREFFEMIKPARKLKTLHLLYCDWLTDEMLSTTLTVCKEIECLDVPSSQITDKSLISIAQLESLVRLSLYSSKVTDEGVMKLLTRCTKLAFLNVNDCSSVSIATLYNAYDLISRGLLNKQLVILFGLHIVRMNTLKNREDISHYYPMKEVYTNILKDVDL